MFGDQTGREGLGADEKGQTHASLGLNSTRLGARKLPDSSSSTIARNCWVEEFKTDQLLEGLNN